jgi:hypothetical protein
MTLGVFGIGIAELVILGIVAIMFLLVAIGVGVVLVAGVSRRKWQPPEQIGPAVELHKFCLADTPISDSARWEGDELRVESSAAGSIALFEIPLTKLEQAAIFYRCQIKPESLKSAVYAEMWCRIPSKGRFFSRGIHQKVSAAGTWHNSEIPFYLEAGQQPDRLELNLVFQGPGVVRLRNIEVAAAPVKGK